MLPGGKNLWQMAVLVALALALGLAVNFFSSEPLPLLRPLPAPPGAASLSAIGEVDADFIGQVLSAPGTLLLDARAAADYRAGHLPGALSLPLGEFARAFSPLKAQLRQAGMLVVYCSGWTCNDSRDLAGRLWVLGLKNLLLYKGGMEDWSGRGRAIEK